LDKYNWSGFCRQATLLAPAATQRRAEVFFFTATLMAFSEQQKDMR
jgi:hypothetical protein